MMIEIDLAVRCEGHLRLFIIPIVAGIPAEVWVAEKLPENPDDPYSTIEIFFADPEYTVQIGSYTV